MTESTAPGNGRLRFEKTDHQVIEELRSAEALLRDETSRVMPDATAAGLLADVLKQWAFLAGLDPDLLNRVGGPQAVLLARYILSQHQENGV